MYKIDRWEWRLWRVQNLWLLLQIPVLYLRLTNTRNKGNRRAFTTFDMLTIDTADENIFGH